MTANSLDVHQLDRLKKAAGYHQVPLRVTHEFYQELATFEPPEPPFGRPAPVPAPIPVGPRVEIVTDGTENVKRVNGAWTFVSEGSDHG